MGWLAFIWAFIVYMLTIAPTVSFWDCGEFIATSYTMAVPHPPGSPLYLILGRIFSMLPTSSDIAHRVNLMSPIVSAASIALLFYIIILLVEEFRGKVESWTDAWIVYGGAFLGAMTFAFTDSHWFNSVEAEVYAMSTFFTALVVWLILRWNEDVSKDKHAERHLLFIAYLMGLAMGVHLLNLLALPFIALIIFFRYKKFEVMPFLGVTSLTALVFGIIYWGVIKGTPRLASEININPAAVSIPLALLTILVVMLVVYWILSEVFKGSPNVVKGIQITLIGLVLITIGYSSYETIFIRSLKDPNIDENDPETVHQAVAYLDREQYGQYSFSRSERLKESPNGRLYSSPMDFFWRYQVKKMYIRYFNWQFIGRNDVSTDFSQLYGIPWIIGWIGMFFHFYRDKNRAFSVLALFVMTGLAIILYLNQPDPQPRERDYSYVGSFLAFSIWIGIGAVAILDFLTERLKSEKLRRNTVAGLAVVLLFLMPVHVLKANYHEHNRWGNYVASDYAYNLLNSCEPNAILFTNGDNDTFPLWYLQEVEKVRTDVRVVNLSLLNTPWYIKQLKYIEPRINIPIPDADIDRLTLIPWEEREVKVKVPENLNPQGEIRWKMKPTYANMGIRVQDLMIWYILSAAQWERPVYLAVTVSDDNKIGLDDYLSMEGLVHKVNPRKVKYIDENAIYNNVMNVYHFRNLDNPKVFFEPNTKRLMQNYRTGFMQAALEFIQDKDNDKAKTLLDAMDEKIPETVIPMTHKELSLQLGRLYLELGDTTSFRNRLDRFQQRPDLRPSDYYLLAQVYFFDLSDYNKAEESVLYAAQGQPNDAKFVSLLYQIYDKSGQYDKALKLLDDWNQGSADDSQIRSLKQNILSKMKKK